MSDDVFILGAGFSKAISKHMPTLDELSKALKPEVKKLFLAGQEPPEEMSSNIETLLSYLAQDYPWLHPKQQLRNQAAFLELSEMIARVFEEKQKIIDGNNDPGWFSSLVNSWHERQVNIITFNYDTLIETEATKIEAPTIRNAGYMEKIDLNDLYPVPITSALLRSSGTYSGGGHRTLKLCKMHGSINWYYSGTKEFYGEPIYYIWNYVDQEEIKTAVKDKVPLVIPPTLDKSVFFKNETIRAIWRTAGKALQGSKRVFCLGYSFPKTDIMVQFFTLTNNPSGEVQFYWVNIEKPHDNLQSMLSRSYIINDAYVREDAVSAFAEDYVNGRL